MRWPFTHHGRKVIFYGRYGYVQRTLLLIRGFAGEV
jgi:hypothetical protein